MSNINQVSNFGFTPAAGFQGQCNDDRAWWAFVQLLASNPYIDEGKREEILKNGLGSHFRASA